MPQNCLNTLLIPIRKSAMKEVRDSNNYRPIALATVISKLFERVILHSTSNMLSTSDNQFGFTANHGTDMCVFVLKQVVDYYVNHGRPIFSVFIDSSKAFDKVSHNILFEKLIERNIPSCFVRLLCFWYSHQQMTVKWGNCFSSFTVSNGVRQGGILSPYVYGVYVDEMSADLNRIKMGCYIGNHKINHLMFADDLRCFAPSIQGLRKLVRICEKYALGHVINFNSDKTVGMYFTSPLLKLNIQPFVSINGSSIKFVSDTKYLGVLLNQRAKDDQDILRQVRYLYCAANTARSKFHRCSNDIKT